MTGATPSALLDLARSLAERAGALLVEAGGDGRGRDLGAAATRKSSRTDLATDADRASEALVRAGILDERPDDAILGEEGGEHTGRSGLTWIVDPLDGTTNFVYGFPAWCVSIAVADPAGVVAGVVHDPLRSETFTATRGGGAFLGGDRLHLGPPPPLAEALVGTGFGYDPERRRQQAALLPRLLPAIRDIRRAGSAALDLCWVAAGRLDAFYEAGLQPWDLSAGLLVAGEAGADHVWLPGPVEVPTLVVGDGALVGSLAGILAGVLATGPTGPPAGGGSPPGPPGAAAPG